ncbi:MAG: hypothetical protein ACK52I_32775 [Pseudomonadota bacterium]
MPTSARSKPRRAPQAHGARVATAGFARVPRLAWPLLLAALLAFAVPAVANAPAVGQQAPAFKLQDQQGKWHTREQ